ncbi:MAG TPA: Fic family protein [Streptosporangiaceae bacterium]|nr:Fic family protein [Streptosporangiaceae bacterium]
MTTGVINFGRGRPSRVQVYARLDTALSDLKRLGGLPTPRESKAIWRDIWQLEAHHSTALEGNTLILREVKTLLESGKAVGAKELRQYLEVDGYAKAAQWVYEQALQPGDWHDGRLVTMAEVRHVHSLALTPVWDVAPHPDATDREGPGSFREHDIEPFGAGMQPPSWTLVAEQVQQWVEDACAAGAKILTSIDLECHAVEELARLHNQFERIHPFIDGNGRAGRLVLNLALVRLGYPPVIIFKQHRDQYLTAMQRADEGDYGRLAELVARSIIDNLERFIVPNIAGPARMVPLAALADKDTTTVALRQAAQRGRLEAERGADGVWRSSRFAVDAYKKARHQRKPAPPDPAKERTDKLYPGQRLSAGESLWSDDGTVRLDMRRDGNLVVAHGADILWDSMTPQTGDANYLDFRPDGNLLLCKGDGTPIISWHAAGMGGHVLVMQSDGNLVMYSPSGLPVWASDRLTGSRVVLVHGQVRAKPVRLL